MVVVRRKLDGGLCCHRCLVVKSLRKENHESISCNSNCYLDSCPIRLPSLKELTIRTALIVASLACGAVATVLGFGFIDDVDWLEDFSGWLALAITLYVAAQLPYDKYHRGG